MFEKPFNLQTNHYEQNKTMTGDYYNTKESVEEYIRLAKDVDGNHLIEELKKFLPTNSTLLELGTGPGTDWNILNKEYQVVGSDNSLEFLNHLKSVYPNGDFIELDADRIETGRRFDGIFSNKVMHHLNSNELNSSVKRQYDVLNSSGVICHSFWQGEGSEVFKGLHVSYHTEKSLREFFEQHYEILMIEKYKEFEVGDSLLLIARKS